MNHWMWGLIWSGLSGLLALCSSPDPDRESIDIPVSKNGGKRNETKRNDSTGLASPSDWKRDGMFSFDSGCLWTTGCVVWSVVAAAWSRRFRLEGCPYLLGAGLESWMFLRLRMFVLCYRASPGVEGMIHNEPLAWVRRCDEASAWTRSEGETLEAKEKI